MSRFNGFKPTELPQDFIDMLWGKKNPTVPKRYKYGKMRYSKMKENNSKLEGPIFGVNISSRFDDMTLSEVKDECYSMEYQIENKDGGEVESYNYYTKDGYRIKISKEEVKHDK